VIGFEVIPNLLRNRHSTRGKAMGGVKVGQDNEFSIHRVDAFLQTGAACQETECYTRESPHDLLRECGAR